MSLQDSLYKEILSNLDEYIYVVNLNTYKIQYISPMLKEKLPKYDEEALCHKNMVNSDFRCITCPCRFLSEDNKSLSLNLYSKIFEKICNYKFLHLMQDGNPYLVIIMSPEKASLLEEEEKRNEMYRVLINITKILGPQENIDEKISECLEDVSKFYDADGCCFYQMNRNKTYQNDYLKDHSFLSNDSKIIKEWSLFFAENRLLVLSKQKKLPITEKIASQIGINELMVVCVKRAGSVVGFLYVVNPKKNIDMTILLCSVAPFIETEFDEDDKTARLDYLAFTDFMTGLRNRTGYNATMESLEKAKCPVGVVFIDINGLKQGNDTYGHEYGDKMIKTIASDLNSFFKDNIFRIGGDEFVVFLPNKTENEFSTLIKRFLEKSQKEVPFSLGSKWFESSEGIEKKISEVDKLMYEEKTKYYKIHGDGRKGKIK